MNIWAWPLIGLAVLVAVVLPAIGFRLFSAERARDVKHAELNSESVVKRVAALRLIHPEIVKIDRVDRNPAYIALHAALLAFGGVVMFGTVPYSNLGSAALGTQYTLGVSLLLGSTMTLTGSLLGVRVFGRCIMPKVCDNVVSPRLGDDVRYPYVLGWWGTVSILLSMVFYDYTVWASAGLGRLLTTYGGIVSIINIPFCLVMIPLFIQRLRRYISERATVLTDAAAILREQDAQ